MRLPLLLVSFVFCLSTAAAQKAGGGPDLGPAKKTESGQAYHEIAPVDGKHRTKLWVYLPQDAKAGATPCVVIAPAGTRMFHGLGLAEGDQAEHTPWVKAGFAVVAYEIESRFEQTMSNKVLIGNIKDFLAAKSGVSNGKAAVAFAKSLPQVDADAIYAVGHSSAGTLALQLAAEDQRIAAAAAFAPVPDLEAHFGDEGPEMLDKLVRGSAKKLFSRSPHKQVSKLRCPTFLFVAEDDDVAPLDRLSTYVDKLKKRNKRVQFTTVARGGHYDPMIEAGIPGAIQWIQGGMQASAASGSKRK